MLEICIDRIGEIIAGEESGRFVEIHDDSSVSGGFLIFIYDTPDRGGEVHDHWVESIVDVELFFAELGWVVQWSRDDGSDLRATKGGDPVQPEKCLGSNPSDD